MIAQAYRFRLEGEPLSCRRYGSGHINETYRLEDTAGREYILQKINTGVFHNPVALMNNIVAVTDHLRKSAASSREVLTLTPTVEGAWWLREEDGSHWRMYEFIADSVCFDQATPAILRESAVAFGRFQRRLADFDAATLTETIPRFHDTPNRYRALRAAVDADALDRAKTAQREIAFALAREETAGKMVDLLARGDLPLRVTHNDTKLNNVLFDRESKRAICVIDLDTVMPGLVANDYGDSIRFGASTAAEDETDLDKVHLSLPLFEAYTEGFLSACGESLTEPEVETLRDGARLMTLECGIRFLADYLSGDTYFHIERPTHNLDRCRTQFRLVAEMEERWETMQRVIRRVTGG